MELFFIEFLCFNVPVQRYPRALRWGWNLGARPNRHLPNTEPSSRVNKTCVKCWIFIAQSSPIASLIVCQGANLLFMVEIPWVVPNNDDNARDWLTLAQAPSDTDIILIKWLAVWASCSQAETRNVKWISIIINTLRINVLNLLKLIAEFII